MNIWLVTIGEPFPIGTENKKLRTAMLADALVQRGHHVTFFISAFNHLKKEWYDVPEGELKVNDNYSINVLKGKGYKKNISLNRFADHRLVAKKFRLQSAQLQKPDIIVASMPPHDLAYEVVSFAKQNNIPVLVDIRDPWPDIFVEVFPKPLHGILKLIFRKEFYFIKKTMRLADGLLATTSTLLNWGLDYAERIVTDNDKVIYLGQKKYSYTDSDSVNLKWNATAKELENKFIVFFVGTVSHYHSPLILIEAAKRLRTKENIHFVIAGNGELFDELKNQSENLSNITLTGWLNDDDIGFWLRRAKVGACTTPKHIDIVPNKAGTYLSANLPIISSFQGDLKTMIEKEQIGFYFPPDNVDALVSSIAKLYEDKSLYKKMSENAKRVFNNLFDANIVYSTYAKHIEAFAKK